MGYKLKRITIRQDTSWHPGANTIAYYEFEQNLNDSSGNGNTATGTGIGYTLVDGQYVVTNTTSTGYINLPNGLGTNIGSGDFTLSFWLYPVTPGGTSDGVLLFGVSSSTTPYYGPNIYFDYYWNKRVTFRLSKENSDRLDLLDIDDSLIGAWHHFVMTRNSGVVSCYIDTTLKGTFNSSVTVPSSTETNVLFARGTDAQAWYNTGAKMDKAILESVGWTATEVSNYYNQTKGNYGYTPEPTLIEKQIRPKITNRTFSYDFSNKTQAQVEADGWTVYTPYNSDADGWYCATPGALARTITDLTNAKKITVNTEAKLATGSWIGSIGWAVSNNSSSSIFQFVSGNTAGNKGTQIYNNGVLGAWTGTSVSGWANSTLEIDLLTREIKATVENNGNTQTATATATAETINAIIANPTFSTYPDSSSHRLKTVQITVEY